jgi:uncharacterized protein with FMN-binding domain
VSSIQITPYLLGPALPPYTFPEYAYVNARPLDSPAAASDLDYVSDGQYIESLDSHFVILTTDANAGDRIVRIELIDQNGNPVWDIPSAAAQPASQGARYTASPTFGSSYGPINRVAVIETPQALLYPGWTLRWTIGGVHVGDQLSNAYLVTTMIPTGDIGAGGAAQPAAIASPVLV